MHSNSANSACDRPMFCRASATSLASTIETRAAFPVFISRTDFSSVSPSAAALDRRGDDLRLFIFDFLANRLDDVSGNVVLGRLAVCEQQPYLCRLMTNVVDHSNSATFPRPGTRPAHLPASTAAGNHVTHRRIRGQPREEFRAISFRPDLVHLLNERGRFDECEHALYGIDGVCRKPKRLEPRRDVSERSTTWQISSR